MSWWIVGLIIITSFTAGFMLCSVLCANTIEEDRRRKKIDEANG